MGKRLFRKPRHSSEEEDVFEVERVLDCRVTCGQVNYLVKWAGYSMDECTWLTVDNFSDLRPVEEFVRERLMTSHPAECSQPSEPDGSRESSLGLASPTSVRNSAPEVSVTGSKDPVNAEPEGTAESSSDAAVGPAAADPHPMFGNAQFDESLCLPSPRSQSQEGESEQSSEENTHIFPDFPAFSEWLY